MRFSRAALVYSVLLTCASAHCVAGSSDRRYRVDELPAPPALEQNCLGGYAVHGGAVSLNDFGVVLAGFSCYLKIDPSVPVYEQKTNPWVATTWFGAMALPVSGPECCSWGQNINNLGQAFGAENMESGGFAGTVWSVGGGRQRVFDLESCDQIRFSAAVGGNGRYTVGWGLRGDPSLPPPVDTLCLASRWLIRSAAGVETDGPLYGSPTAINAFDLALGTSNRSAITYHVPTRRTRVLHAADDAHTANTSDINDLGEAAGWIALNATPGVANQCDPGLAVRWSRSGMENVLPHLAGAVSSRAWGVGYAGETVGESGEGVYCAQHVDGATERAVLWQGSRVFDLNSLIPRSSGVTLSAAVAINRLGQIAATGYVDAEPLTTCVEYAYEPEGAQLAEVPCRRTRVFLLTPTRR